MVWLTRFHVSDAMAPTRLVPRWRCEPRSDDRRFRPEQKRNGRQRGSVPARAFTRQQHDRDDRVQPLLAGRTREPMPRPRQPAPLRPREHVACDSSCVVAWTSSGDRGAGWVIEFGAQKTIDALRHGSDEETTWSNQTRADQLRHCVTALYITEDATDLRVRRVSLCANSEVARL